MHTTKTKIISATMALLVAIGWQADAQIYDTNNEVVQTFAGFGIPGDVDGQGQFTAFSAPAQIASDTASNLFVWDSGNARIRKITPDGTVTTFAGGGSYLDGYGTNVSLNWGQIGAMAMDHADILWLVMVSGYNGLAYLVTIDTNGYVSQVNGGLANLGGSSGICFDSADILYYSGGNKIYRYNPVSGVANAVAGSGISGYYDGQGTLFSAFNNPTVLTCDQANTIYVWDSGNNVIRRIDQNQKCNDLRRNPIWLLLFKRGRCGDKCHLQRHQLNVLRQPVWRTLFGLRQLCAQNGCADERGDTGRGF